MYTRVTMASVSVREARENFRSLLDRVSAGEEISLLRRGKEVARLSPPKGARRKLPSLDAFRRSIRVKGRPLSEEVVRGRREERY
jgi:prevent-host-death family protein